jgi:hypothetical protein
MARRRSFFASIILVILLLPALAQAQTESAFLPTSSSGNVRPGFTTTPIRFAVIGDFGLAGANEQSVANLVKSWSPDFIITTGDDNYPLGAAATIDANIGQYYHDFIYPYTGSYGAGATTNRFFPTAGNHDWETPNLTPYLDYFTLPGNERYYDFTQGPVQFFVVDSDSREPDGVTSTSTQANWLQARLAASTARWKVVYMHHPPYSSGTHGSTVALQWPFQAWGASIVLTGHDHTYERLMENGFPYIVNGLGGYSIYQFGTPVAGSTVRYNANYGAMLVDACDDYIVFRFINITNTVVDTYALIKPGVNLTVTRSDDDGSGRIGMLSTLLSIADTGRTINFDLGSNNKVDVNKALPPVPSGVHLTGTCDRSGAGPGVTIDGHGITGDGLVLQGKVDLFGIKVTNFKGRLIKSRITGTGNKLDCVSAIH